MYITQKQSVSAPTYLRGGKGPTTDSLTYLLGGVSVHFVGDKVGELLPVAVAEGVVEEKLVIHFPQALYLALGHTRYRLS